jgi:glycosyltransferase involved in cell wall biosynthesis
MDYEGKYCDVPHINTCTSCLSKNKQEFTSLFLERDMPKWRSIWGSVLDYADQIVTFSDNSSKLLLKAYPQIDPARILIVRHKVTHLPDRMPKITNTYSLRIGVVGHIGFHKGSYFVQALAREIKRRDLDVKIVVIGSIETSCESLVVTQTGSYTHAVLPELIERTGVNVFLFSSICAETFSYVVEELVSMDLPIACFKLGAPSERLATYSKGRVLSSMDSGVVLDDLITFHRDIYLAN